MMSNYFKMLTAEPHQVTSGQAVLPENLFPDLCEVLTPADKAIKANTGEAIDHHSNYYHGSYYQRAYRQRDYHQRDYRQSDYPQRDYDQRNSYQRSRQQNNEHQKNAQAKWGAPQFEQHIAHLTHQLSATTAQYQQEITEKERLSQRLESLLHILPAGVVVIDAQGIVVECNQVAVDLLGEPLLGEVWRDLIIRCFAPRDDDGHEISLKDGRRVSIATRSLESEPGQIILLNDLTETRRLQQALSHHERLSALGKMVASLAHQIRTPLSAAMLYAGHLMKGTLPPLQQINFAEKLMARLSHLDRQVKDMLVFARGELPMVNQVSVAEFFTNLQQAVDGVSVFQRATIEWHCPVNSTEARPAWLQCNQDALLGACLNLMTNAIEAATQQPTSLLVTTRVTSSRLIIAIKDNGPGMTQTQIKQAKEPFFTTKAQGTGLGIAVVQAVVRAHQGDFQLYSIPDQGTSAQISIPLLTQQQAETASLGKVVDG